jgi:hypothetical protein
MTIENFNHTIDYWIKELEQYTLIQLCTKPSSTSWSLGQMYRHLIDDANFYVEQIKICVVNNDHATKEPTAHGKAMLYNNDFPNEVIVGSPNNAFIPQPESKEQLMNDLLNLKVEMNTVAAMISKSPFNGKTKHPGLGYFSAKEWLQFADMHFRHHLRQKKRIDDFFEIK